MMHLTGSSRRSNTHSPPGPRLSYRQRFYPVWAVVFILSACTNTIVAPTPVSEQATVFVVDHGRHASLAIPAASGGVAHYSYGAWQWYALADEDLLAGASALFGSDGALGRQNLAIASTAGAVGDAMREGFVQVLPVTVAAASVEKLRRHLDEEFKAHEASELFSAEYNLHFVKIPDGYSFRSNSNAHVSQWLEELGCTVTGFHQLSNWRLAPNGG